MVCVGEIPLHCQHFLFKFDYSPEIFCYPQLSQPSLLQEHGYNYLSSDSTLVFYHIVRLFTVLNSFSDFFIYCLTSRQFRKDLCQLFDSLRFLVICPNKKLGNTQDILVIRKIGNELREMSRSIRQSETEV